MSIWAVARRAKPCKSSAPSGGRALAPSLWIDAWRRGLEKLALESGSDDDEDLTVVVDDVRFPNEVAAIRALGGAIVRVERPGSGLTGASSSHAGDLCRLRGAVSALAAVLLE